MRPRDGGVPVGPELTGILAHAAACHAAASKSCPELGVRLDGDHEPASSPAISLRLLPRDGHPDRHPRVREVPEPGRLDVEVVAPEFV